MYVDNSWLSLDPIYLSLLHKFSDKFSDMDVRVLGVLRYHLIRVPWPGIVQIVRIYRKTHCTNIIIIMII